MVWTPLMCALSRAMSAESAAAAGAAAATSATGTSTRANFVGKLMSKLLEFCAGNWRSPIECALNPAVPEGSASDRVPVGVDQHLTAANMVRLADETVLFHPLDQSSRTVVADAELALKVGSRCLLALGDDLHRLAVEL